MEHPQREKKHEVDITKKRESKKIGSGLEKRGEKGNGKGSLERDAGKRD